MTENVPTVVTVSSTVGSGEGGLVIPNGHPIILHVMKPVTIIAVRAARVYLQTLLGLLMAGGLAPEAIPFTDFLDLLRTGALLALAPAVVSILQNMVELLTQFDQKNPTLTV